VQLLPYYLKNKRAKKGTLEMQLGAQVKDLKKEEKQEDPDDQEEESEVKEVSI